MLYIYNNSSNNFSLSNKLECNVKFKTNNVIITIFTDIVYNQLTNLHNVKDLLQINKTNHCYHLLKHDDMFINLYLLFFVIHSYDVTLINTNNHINDIKINNVNNDYDLHITENNFIKCKIILHYERLY